MLRLRNCVLTHNLLSPATYPSKYPVSCFHRLISAAAPVAGPRFAAEEYLVDTCGLTRQQALKAAPKLSHLKPPSKAGTVLAFLADLGLSGAQVAALVAKDPVFLSAGAERTLDPVFVGLTGLGLLHSEVSCLASHYPSQFRCKTIVSKLQYYLPLFGSFDNFFRALKFNTRLLAFKLERSVKPNVAVLRECGLSDCDIAKLGVAVPRMLTDNLERIREIVACAEGLGVPRGSSMFRHALHAVAFDCEETIAAKLEYLKKTFRWSDAEVGIAVSRAPPLLTGQLTITPPVGDYVDHNPPYAVSDMWAQSDLGGLSSNSPLLTKSKDMLQGRSDFLISVVGLEPAYVAHRPAIVSYSLEGRLRPRYYVLEFLKKKVLIEQERSYYSVVMVTEKLFVEKYICPHEEAAPHLAEDYVSACKGKVPANFIFP